MPDKQTLYIMKKSRQLLWDSVVRFFEMNHLDTSVFTMPTDKIDFGRKMNKAFATMRNLGIDQDFYTFYKGRKRGKANG